MEKPSKARGNHLTDKDIYIWKDASTVAGVPSFNTTAAKPPPNFHTQAPLFNPAKGPSPSLGKMPKGRESENQKVKGKAPQDKCAAPKGQEADQAASGAGGSEATLGTGAEASTPGPADATAQDNTATRTAAAAAPRTPLPFWGRPHPSFGTVADPADHFRRASRAWIPLGRPRRVRTVLCALPLSPPAPDQRSLTGGGRATGHLHPGGEYGDAEDEQEDE